MRTDLQARRRVRGQDGFTLIEVLIAMLILGVGLLGLEALGIGAARMVGRAERQGDYIAAASSRLETTMAAIRNTGGPTPPPLQTEEIPGAQLRTESTGIGRLWTVKVTVTPTDSTHLRDTYVLTGNVFR